MALRDKGVRVFERLLEIVLSNAFSIVNHSRYGMKRLFDEQRETKKKVEPYKKLKN